MQINSLHGTLFEFGETIHKGRTEMAREFPKALERIVDRWYRKQLISVAKQNETCKRLLDIPGVGPLIATAAVATMGEASAFKSEREFAAYVGLEPKQTGSGGKFACWG